MKKIIFTLTVFFLSANVFPAAADSYNYRPYAGIAYVFSHDNGDEIKGDYSLGGVYLGSDYSKYFATELFFNQSGARKNYPHSAKIKTSYRNYGLDLIAALPLEFAEKISLLGTAGIGEYVFKVKKYPQKHSDDHAYGYRFGGGVKYAADKNWQFRALARYVKFDHADIFNHAMEYSFSAEYHF